MEFFIKGPETCSWKRTLADLPKEVLTGKEVTVKEVDFKFTKENDDWSKKRMVFVRYEYFNSMFTQYPKGMLSLQIKAFSINSKPASKNNSISLKVRDQEIKIEKMLHTVEFETKAK